MASKLNKRFIFILTGIIVMLGIGIGGIAYIAISGDAERQVRMGKEDLAAGEAREALGRFARAIGKDPTNLEYFDLFEEALLQIVPESQSEASERYLQQYLGVLERRKAVSIDKPESWIRLLDALWLRAELFQGAGSDVWQTVQEQAERMVSQFGNNSSPAAEAAVAHARGIQVFAMSKRRDLLKPREALLFDEQIEVMTTAGSKNPLVWEAVLREKFEASTRHARKGDMRLLERDLTGPKGFDSIVAAMEAFGAEPSVNIYGLQVHRARLTELPGMDDAKNSEAYAAMLVLGENATATIIAAGPNDDVTDELNVLRMLTRTSALSLDDVYSFLEPVLDTKKLDLDILFMLFQNAMQSEPELAIKAAEQALEMEPLSVGLMSMLQTRAREGASIALFEAAYTRRTDETNSTPIEELVVLAERAKQEHAGNAALGSLTLYLNGSIALAEEDYAVARSNFTELSTHMFVQSPSMQGRFVPRFVMASLGSGERGIAIAGLREFADRISEQQAIPLRLALATQLIKIGELEDARIEVQRVINADGTHEDARELLDEINQFGIAVRAMPAGIDTFRARVISRVRAALGEGRNEDALIVLRSAVADKAEPPVEFLRMLIGINMLLGNDAEARGWASQIPNVEDDPLIQRQMLILDIDEIVERTRAMVAIDQTDPADQAALFFSRIAAIAGGPSDTTGSAAEAVDAALDAALAEFTLDSRLQMMLIVQVQKLDEANALMGSTDPYLPEVMAILEQVNLDPVFLPNLKAQIALDNDDPLAALALLQPLKDSGLGSADTEFLMGLAYQRAGRFGDSVDSFAEAVRRAPDNSEMILRYVGALERAGEQEKALVLLRRSRQSPILAIALREAWLDAESRFGDTAEALRNRMIIYASEVEDSKAHEGVVINWGNALELSRLLMLVAPTFRDVIQANGNVGISASAWAALSGADRRAALSLERGNRERAAFQLLLDVEAAAKTDNEKATAKIAMIFAELGANGKDAARATAEAMLDCCSDILAFGTRTQLALLLDQIDATDLAKAQFDVLVKTGEPAQLRGIISQINGTRYGDELIAAARAVVEATGSPQDQVLLADSLIVTGDLAEAGALIDHLAASEGLDSNNRLAYDVVLLGCVRESRFAREKFVKLGKLITARGSEHVPSQEESALAAEVLVHALAGVRLGTEASVIRPDALMPLLRIHELHRIQASVKSTEAIIADALVNAKMAHALAPAAWTTNRALLQSHLMANDPKSSFQVVDRYLRQGGTHEESLTAIVSTARMSGEIAQALPALKVGMNNSPMEKEWPGMIAAVMLEVGDVENAAEIWWRVLEIDSSPTAIGRFVELEFRRQQPNMSRIAELSVQWPEAFAEHPELMAAQAAVLAHTGESLGARRSYARAYEQARKGITQGDDPMILDRVLGHLLRVYTDQSLAEIETQLSVLVGGKMGAHEYAALANGALMNSTGQRDLQAAKRYLRSASELAQDEPDFRMALLHRLSTVLYVSDDCDGAVRALEEVVSLGGTSAGTLNNLAYMLTICRNDPQAAVAYAEQAVRLNPNSSSYLDTLGFIQLKLGRLEAAEGNLRNSLSLQPSVENLLHLAQLLLQTERSDQAEVILQRLANEFPRLTPEQQNKVNALVSAIG